jgi:hypothetical protein
MAFAKWKQAHCEKCQVVLEIVPWTKFAGMVLAFVILLAPVFAGSLLAAKFFPDNAFLRYLNRPKNAPAEAIPSHYVAYGLLLKLLYIPWVCVVFGFVLPRVVRLRVSYDPQQPLSIR